MIIRRQLSRAQAEAAMQRGEFDESVRAAAGRIAVVLSQDWCGQWTAMDRYLDELATDGRAGQPEGIVFQLVYNQVDYFEAFMRFKESVFGNDQIPYVRYYRDGRLVGQSNYVSASQFLSRFGG